LLPPQALNRGAMNPEKPRLARERGEARLSRGHAMGPNSKVLLTGGAGFVGSHAAKAFHGAGWNVVTVDDLRRGHSRAVRWGPLVRGDIGDRALLDRAIDAHRPDLIAHFAAYAYVGESVTAPGNYYRNNSVAMLTLLEAMRDHGIGRLLFSSSCATYGHPVALPITETHPQRPINPYGWSKMMAERMVEDFGRAHGISATMLRYFNAAGCDLDGEIGEDHDPETHAVPLAIDAALGIGPPFRVFGTDFDTRDGSAIRDYVHVADLARAHVLAGEQLLRAGGVRAINLGSGMGVSVLELLDAVGRAVGRPVPSLHTARREGDPAELVASFALAREVLGWEPALSSLNIIVDSALAWRARGLERRTVS